MPTIDVVVPVYGKWDLTASCLRHLAAQTVAHRVVLVDDKSPDDTLERVRDDFPEVDVVALPVNGGFAAACNRGIAHGTGDIVVLLNNDVDAEPDMLEELVRPFGDLAVGSVAALLLRPDGRVDSFGICADPTMAGFVRGHGAGLAESGTELPALLGPYGAAAAYRRTALEQVGGFDEGILMYGEELDLALRMRQAGWQAVAAPLARGVHVGGATSGKGSSRQRYLSGYGRGYLMRSYNVMTSRQAVRAFVTEATVCAAATLSFRDAEAVKGRIDGWRAARRADKRHGKVGVDDGIGFARSLRMRQPRYWETTSIDAGPPR